MVSKSYILVVHICLMIGKLGVHQRVKACRTHDGSLGTH